MLLWHVTRHKLAEGGGLEPQPLRDPTVFETAFSPAEFSFQYRMLTQTFGLDCTVTYFSGPWQLSLQTGMFGEASLASVIRGCSTYDKHGRETRNRTVTGTADPTAFQAAPITIKDDSLLYGALSETRTHNPFGTSTSS